MTINGRTKGHSAERNIAKALNGIYYDVLQAHGMPIPETPPVQRNQNQSAVGGDDLVGTLDFSIEVKRQEGLALNTWWAQAVLSAGRSGKVPVVLFKQNHQKWRALTHGKIGDKVYRVEISFDDFCTVFREELLRRIPKADL